MLLKNFKQNISETLHSFIFRKREKKVCCSILDGYAVFIILLVKIGQ